MTITEKYSLALLFFELLSFITGIATWRKYAGTHWRYFIVFLGIIVLSESLSWYFLKVAADKRLNTLLYTHFVIPLEFSFYFWLYYKQFLNKRYKSLRYLPLTAFAIYAVCFIMELTLLVNIKELKWFTSISYTIGNLFLLILILAYLLRFSRSEEIIYYKTNNMFWVSVGLMVFFLGSFPFFGMANYLYENYQQLFFRYKILTYLLNYIMYALFSIALLWGKPK